MANDVEFLLGGIGRSNVVPFGKYKGQPMEVLRHDPEYVQWALDNGVISETKYRDVYIFLTGAQGENHDTPEHNRYQVMFLEPLFVGDVWDELFPGHRERCARVDREHRLRAVVGKGDDVVGKLQRSIEHHVYEMKRYAGFKYMDPELMTPMDRYNFHSTKNRSAHQVEVARIERELMEDKEKLVEAEKLLEIAKAQMVMQMAKPVTPEELPAVQVEFEIKDRMEGGYPARDRFGKLIQYGGSADVQLQCEGRIIRVEIKPSMGDDYPAVLRQMKASECQVLYLVNYEGKGATLDQVKKVFQMSGVAIMEHAE